MQVINLNNGFEIEANGRKLTAFHLNARRNKRLDWSGEYSFANLPASYITVEEENESVIAPLINDLVLTEAGGYRPGLRGGRQMCRDPTRLSRP